MLPVAVAAKVMFPLLSCGTNIDTNLEIERITKMADAETIM